MAHLLIGCESYRSVPLVENHAPSLAQAASTIRLQDALIENPLLRNVKVDLADGLSPDEAAAVAVILNPTVRAARDRAAVVDAQLRQAGIVPNPTLAFGVDVPVGSNTAGEVTGYGLSIEWEITSLITRGAKLAAATQAARQGRLDIAWQEWQVAQAARQATYDLIAVHDQLESAEVLSTRLDGIAHTYRDALNQHDVLASDAAAVDAAAGEARIAVAAAKRDLADADIALRRAIGVDADSPLTIDWHSALPSTLAVPDAAVLTHRLAEHRIDLVALRRGYDSQEETVRAAILGQFPRISLGISHTRDTGDFLTLGPALSIDLPVFDRNQGNIAIERATRQQLKDEYAARLFEARSDVTRSVAAVRAIGEQIAVVESQTKSLRAVVDAAERALTSGDAGVSNYYTAAVSLAQRQTDLIKLNQELTRARITLEIAAGVYLPGAE